VENVGRFVADGGTLLVSFFSGIVDGRDHIRLGGYPAPFRELLGLHIEDFAPMAEGERNTLDTQDGGSYACGLWADLIHLEGAEALASYTGGFYAGTPAATRNVYGEGAAYYLGTRPEEHYTHLLLKRVCEEAGVGPTLEAPPGVDAVRRINEDLSYLFVVNHNDEAVEVRLPNPGRNLLAGTEHDSQLVLEPLEVAILHEKR
jgi:beta-galactosidase